MAAAAVKTYLFTVNQMECIEGVLYCCYQMECIEGVLYCRYTSIAAIQNTFNALHLIYHISSVLRS